MVNALLRHPVNPSLESIMRRALPVSFIVSCVALLLTAVAGLVVWLGSRDLPAPDVTDLVVDQITLSAESNAYVQLLQAGEALVLTPADRDYLARNAKLRDWDLIRAAEILTLNDVALAGMDAALALPDYAEPRTLHMRDLSRVGALAQLKSLHIQTMLWDLDYVSAQREAMVLARFGHRAQGACGSLIGYLAAGSVRLQGVWMAQVAALSAPELSIAQAQQLIADLAELMPSSEAAARALRIDAMAQYRTFGELAGTAEPDAASKGGLLSRYSFHLHRTQLGLANSIRHRLPVLGEPLADVPAVPPARVGWRQLVQPNGVGRNLLSLLAPSYDSCAQRLLADRVCVSAAQVAIAFRAFSLAEQRAPATLAELVPRLLPAVPQDPFDGAPLRYDPKRRLVYSIGANRVDDGGHSRPTRGSASLQQDDIVVGLLMAHYITHPRLSKSL
jgi:hypothetical protein